MADRRAQLCHFKLQPRYARAQIPLLVWTGVCGLTGWR